MICGRYGCASVLGRSRRYKMHFLQPFTSSHIPPLVHQNMFKFHIFWLFLTATLAIDSPCNPLKDSACVARNNALSSAVYESMTFEPRNFQQNMGPPNIVYDSDGAKMKILERGQNPQLASSKYIMYGRAEAEVKASHGKSVISSMYMQSDDLDEIDIGEFFGGKGDEFQTNYFVKGNISNYDRDRYHKAYADLTQGYHKFAVEWTPDHIMWFYDGRVIRKVLNARNPHGFPASPMRLMFSLWIGGDPENHPGTIEWSGGEADFQGMPYTMGIRNVRLVDYSSGHQYVYGNGQDVDATRGEIFGRKKRDDGEEETPRDWDDSSSYDELDEYHREVPDGKEKEGRTEYEIDHEFDQGIENKGLRGIAYCGLAFYCLMAVLVFVVFTW